MKRPRACRRDEARHFITLHVPLVDATRDLVNADNRPHAPVAVLLNFSRETAW